MGINEIIMYIMMSFMLIAAVDRIFSQFGGSEAILGKIGLVKSGKALPVPVNSSKKALWQWVRWVWQWSV